MSTPRGDGRGLSEARRALLPSPTLPLAYFAGAHIAFALACSILIVQPGLPGAFHYHPRAIALVHLVTLGWISGSILGALYVVGPLALAVPLRTGRADLVACASFWIGAAGIVWGFWSGAYGLLAVASAPLLAAMAFVGARVTAGLRSARVPFGVSLHVVLAFANVLGAGTLGIVMAVTRLDGSLSFSPLSLAIAHGHLAVLGWAIMMIFGVAYRLIPMVVPAAMPAGRGLATSAVLLEAGTLGLTAALAFERLLLPWVALVAAAFVSFFVQIRRIVRERRPRPAELPPRDWSTWQAHAAMLYLLVAAGAGIYLALRGASPAAAWVYGVAGLIGFVSQMIVGIQGRLLPLQAWYRSMARREGVPPGVSVHQLVEARWASLILLAWLSGVPAVMAGLALERRSALASGAAALLVATVANAAYAVRMVRLSR